MENVKKHLLSLPQTEKEQQWIKNRLADFTVKEGFQLAAVTMRTAPQNGMEAINCLLTMHDYEVCWPASSYKALGEFYLRHEGGLAAELVPFVDTEQLGQIYEDMYPGLFIGDCYVSYPEGPVNRPYDGTNLELLEDKDWSIKVKLASPSRPEGVWLRLPDYSLVNDGPPDEVALALRELEVQSVSDCTILDAKCVLPEISSLMEQYDDPTDLIYDGNDLGFVLDEQGQGMPGFMERFAAAMEYEHCHTLKFALDISQNLNCYQVVSASRVTDFARGELGKQGFPPRDAPELAQCFDHQKYGEELLEQQGFQLNAAEDRYIRRTGQEFHYERTQPPMGGMTMK